MRKLYFIALLLFSALPLISQEQSTFKYTDLNAEPARSRGETHAAKLPGSPGVIARISIVAPMFVLEFAPTDHFIFSTGIRIWPTFRETNSEGVKVYHPSLNPRINLEPRYFITQSHRRLRSRRTDYYSGWYLGLPFSMALPELDFSMGTVMGFQCTFGSRWYWNVGLGPAASYQDARFRMIPTGTAAFGIILN